jgi:hypothetical protein
MLAPREMPDFKDPDQRTQWIKEHAERFTCSYRKRTVIVHTEHPSLHEARRAAWFLTQAVNGSVMIYAVYGPHDSWIETVKLPT